MKRVNDGYRLSTGRILTDGGLRTIGLDPEDLHVSTGYDSTHYEVHPDVAHAVGDDPKDVWTAEERSELADFMIAAWQRFKDRDLPLRDTKPFRLPGEAPNDAQTT